MYPVVPAVPEVPEVPVAPEVPLLLLDAPRLDPLTDELNPPAPYLMGW